MNKTIGKNKKKLQNAILFFSKNCAVETVGKTKLAKLLYYLDFDHYEKHLEPVTRAVYVNKDRGPIPDDFYYQLEEMRKKGKIKIERIKMPSKYEKDMELIISLSEPDLQIFSSSEIETLKAELKKWKYASGKDMSDKSHEEAPWKGTRKNDIVPYQLALHRD